MATPTDFIEPDATPMAEPPRHADTTLIAALIADYLLRQPRLRHCRPVR